MRLLLLTALLGCAHAQRPAYVDPYELLHCDPVCPDPLYPIAVYEWIDDDGAFHLKCSCDRRPI